MLRGFVRRGVRGSHGRGERGRKAHCAQNREARVTFSDIDGMRYCGMEGKMNGYLTIRRANPKCELDGLLENGPVEE